MRETVSEFKGLEPEVASVSHPVGALDNIAQTAHTFQNLLYSTGMIRVVRSKSAAVFLIYSRQENGVWVLRILKPDGTIVMKKTVKYRPNP